MSTLVNAAMDLLSRGRSIIPVGFPSKAPLIKEVIPYRERQATLDELDDWFRRYPDMGLGLITTGEHVVVDTDTQSAEESISELLPKDFQCPTVITPRPGKHRYFKAPLGLQLTCTKLFPGCDFKAQGGYVVCPPSRNQDGIEYRWVPGLSYRDITAPTLPDALLKYLHFSYREVADNGFKNCRHLSSVSSTVVNMFEYGNRDNSLFHVANTLVRGGMPEAEIYQVLESLIISWGEAPDKKWINTKIKSALDRTDRRERNLTAEVRDFALSSFGVFMSSDVVKNIDLSSLSSRNAQQQVSKALNRLRTEGVIEPYGEKRGCFRRVENEAEPIDFLNCTTQEFPVVWPLGVQELCKLYPGNIAVVAGSKSAGKTAFLLNTVRENMNRYEVIYLNSEMGDVEFRSRLEGFEDMPLADWKIKAYHRNSNFADLITGERKIYIIDYLEISSDFWKVSQFIKEIHAKLKGGICIIALQKADGKEVGRGADFSREKSRLYLSLDYLAETKVNRIKVIDAKAWRTHENPRGKFRTYKLVNGARFVPKSDWTE